MQRDVGIENVADAVLHASRVLVALSARSIADIADDVTVSQFRALVVLHSRGPQPLRSLASELQVVPSTATRMCDRLVDKGLIVRSTMPDDRREVRLALTSAGRQLVSAVSARRYDAIRKIVEQMPPDARGALVEAMEAFGRAAGEVPEQQWHLGWT